MASLTRSRGARATPRRAAGWHTLLDWWAAALERHRQRRALAALSDDLLKDIGISREEGTSMAVPHVSAAAALVIASGVVGTEPTPMAVQQRLQATARDLGAPGYDEFYGWGLLDAAAATTPG